MKLKGEYFVSFLVLKNKNKRNEIRSIGNARISIESEPETFYDEILENLENDETLKPDESICIIGINKL